MEETTNLKTISIQVPLVPAYSNSHITLNATTVDLEISLTEGEHRLLTPLIDIGHSIWYGVMQGQLTLWYHYEPEDEIITFYGNDLISSKSLCLTTVPGGSSNASLQYTHAAPNPAESLNIGWNHNTQLTPGLEDALRESVRLANKLIIEKAISIHLTVKELAPIPKLDPKIYEQLCPVYRNGEFLEYYNPEKLYGPNDTIVPIDSISAAKMTIPSGKNFVNVIDSTPDPQIKSQSWIALWRAFYGPETYCTSYGYDGFDCSIITQSLLGGHCMFGIKSTRKSPGSNQVFITPICSRHNSNDSTIMNPIITQNAVSLSGYMQKPT